MVAPWARRRADRRSYGYGRGYGQVGHSWQPLATLGTKPQEGHPPGASRITLPRHYFEDQPQNHRE